MENYIETRSAERYEVEVPVYLEEGTGISRNISSSGIYFLTDKNLREGMLIKFSVSFEYAVPGRTIEVHGQAMVKRVEPQNSTLGVAAQIIDINIPQSKEETNEILLPDGKILH
ncbi:MAG TPA: PilZ domain-containing protein [Desulfuromonadales bacterium]|nr:PilZ domain-containing protein [Desulfuromonadales bacterium]